MHVSHISQAYTNTQQACNTTLYQQYTQSQHMHTICTTYHHKTECNNSCLEIKRNSGKLFSSKINSH